MPSIDSTVGGASSNSYATVSDADTYFNERVGGTEWAGSTDQKERALITATRRLDQESYEGLKVSEGQALKWPRYWADNEDGTEYAENAIPTIVKYACYELALQYEIDRGDSKTPLLDTGLEEYTEAEVGSLKMTRNRSFSAGQLPATVQRLLRPVITTAGNSRRVGAAY